MLRPSRGLCKLTKQGKMDSLEKFNVNIFVMPFQLGMHYLEHSRYSIGHSIRKRNLDSIIQYRNVGALDRAEKRLTTSFHLLHQL